MDDADPGWHASQIRRVALELEDALPAGQWQGPSQLECRARIMEIRDDLLSCGATGGDCRARDDQMSGNPFWIHDPGSVTVCDEYVYALIVTIERSSCRVALHLGGAWQLGTHRSASFAHTLTASGGLRSRSRSARGEP